LSYADLDGSGTIESGSEILEEKNYYPFGLQHDGYNMGVKPQRSVEAEQIKYNGKEFEDSFGLNMYEMDLRQYDPAIGRWIVQDPVVHHDFSPYSAFDNNPVYWADPSGADSQPTGNSINIDKLFKDSEHGDTYVMEGGKLSYNGKQTEAQIKQTYEMSSLNEGSGGGNGWKTQLAKKLYENYKINYNLIIAYSIISNTIFETTEVGELSKQAREEFISMYAPENLQKNSEVYSLVIDLIKEIKNANKGSKYLSDVYFYYASGLFGGKATALAIENYQLEKLIKKLDKNIYYQINPSEAPKGGGFSGGGIGNNF